MRIPLPAVPAFLFILALAAVAASPGCTRVADSSRPSLTPDQARIQALLDQGKYDEAQASAESLLNTRTSDTQKPPSADETAVTTDLAIEARWRNGNGSHETLAVATQAVESRRAPGRERHLASSLHNLGRLHLLVGNPSAAVASLEESVGTLDRSGGGDDITIAAVLDSLGMALAEMTRYDDAARVLRRARLAREQSRDDEPGLARTMELTSLVAMRVGQYQEARASLDRALALRARRPSHPETAATYSLEGDLLWLEGRPAAARDAAARCVKAAETSLRPNHPDLARCTRQLGNMLASLGDMSGALVLLERAAEIARKSLGAEHQMFSGYLNDLAEVHRVRKDYQKARALYEQALATRERRLGRDHQNLAGIVYNLGLVSAELGDLAEAERQFERAASIWRQMRPDHPFVALAMSSQAQALMRNGHAGEALTLQRQVLAIRERSLGPNHPDTGDTLADVAAVLVSLGRIPEAAKASERAIAIWDQPASADSPGLAAALTSRGNTLVAIGDVTGAQNTYARALSITERALGPEHPNASDLRVRLGWVALTGGDVAHAFDEALAAERASRIFLQSTARYLTEREALSYGATRPNGLNLVLSVATGTHALRVHAGPSLDAVIRTRALVLDEIAARKHTVRERQEPGLTALWAAWTTSRQTLANLVVRGGAARADVNYQAASDEARRAAERAERALAERSATFKAERNRAEIGLAEVTTALPAGSALVSFVRYSSASNVGSGLAGARGAVPSYVAFVLSTASSSPVVVPLGAATPIENTLAAWRRGLTMASGAGTLADRERRLRVVGERLRRQIWDPVAAVAGSTSRMFIVPDGALHLVNFAALPMGASEYLLDHGPTIHYLTAERDLPQFAAPSPRSAATGLLAIGGASFDVSGAPVQKGQTRAGGGPSTQGGCASFESLQFSPLQATLGEVQDVAQVWNAQTRNAQIPKATDARSAELLTGPAATERAFKAQAPGRRVLHLATHGFFLGGDCAPGSEGRRAVGGVVAARSAQGDSTDNPLLQAGLALAGANSRTRAKADEEDGILTAEEVASMNLEGVEWAVLSACDTGLGQIKAGEGVFGLRRAFQIAGARTVIMSLWSVEDRPTSEWMLALYQARLTGNRSTADAVRDASLSMVRQRRAKGLSTHPFYWAAFVAAGDWH
jgi:CHAT domain-containing protein